MAVPLAVLAIVVALITPLPGFVLDLLIVTDILMSVTVLMVVAVPGAAGGIHVVSRRRCCC